MEIKERGHGILLKTRQQGQCTGQKAVPGCVQDLTEAMNAHLRLHFVNDELADQNVLSIYPTTLRRRALRHLYMKSAQG